MTIRRRPFLLEAGEELLLSHSAVTVASRFDDFVTASGIDPEYVFSDPLCATPLPIYRKGEDGTLARWAGANPAFLWHPVMWLPANVALRYQVREDQNSDQVRLETDHEWAIRVTLELQAANLYDSDSGGWLDILALHGLDIENPVDYARVEAWLAGAADITLDGIDLADLITNDQDEDWAFRTTQDFIPVFVPAQWALMAESLTDTLDTEVGALTDPGEKRRLLTAITALASTFLGDVPTDDDSTENTSDDLIELQDDLEDTLTDIGALEGRLRDLLAGITAAYSYAVESLDTRAAASN